MKEPVDYTPIVWITFLIILIVGFVYFIKRDYYYYATTKGYKSNNTIQVYGDKKMGYVVAKGEKLLWSDDASDTLKMKIAITK